MPASDAVIGRVSIKVIPDTSGFRERLKAQLAAMRRVEFKVHVEPVLDRDALNRMRDELSGLLTFDDEDYFKKRFQDIVNRSKIDDLLGGNDLSGAFKKRLEEAERLRKKLQEIKDAQRGLGYQELSRAVDRANTRLRRMARTMKQLRKWGSDGWVKPQLMTDREWDKFKRDAKRRFFNIPMMPQPKDIDGWFGKPARLIRDTTKWAGRETKKLLAGWRDGLVDVAETWRGAWDVTMSGRDYPTIRQDVKAWYDDSLLKRGIDATRKYMDRMLGEINTRLSFDENHSVLKKKLQETFGFIEAKVRPEVIREAADRAKHYLKEKFEDIRAGIGAEVKKLQATKAYAFLRSVFRTIRVSIIPVVSKKALAVAKTTLATLTGARMGKQLFDDLFFDRIKDLDKNLPKLAGFTMLAGNAASAIMVLGGNILTFGKSLVQILPLALAMPTVLMGIAAGAAALVVGLQDFGNRLPEVKQQFTDLKKSMQDGFWEQALAPIRTAARTFMPELIKGMNETASGMGRMFGAFGTGLAKNVAPSLGTFFKGVKEANVEMTKMMEPFTRILGVFSRLGGDLLPRAARKLNEWVDGWAKWLEQGEKDGSLLGMINKAIENAGHLWRLLKNIGSTLNALATPIEKAGGSTLKTAADEWKEISNYLWDPSRQKALEEAFQGAHRGWENFKNAIKPGVSDLFRELTGLLSNQLPKLGTSLGTLLGGLLQGLTSPASMAGINGFLDGIHGAVKTLEPQFRTFGANIGEIFGVAGDAVRGLTPVLLGVFDLIDKIVKAFKEPLSGFFTELRPIAEDLRVKLDPIVDALVKIAAQAAKEGLNGLLRAFKDFGSFLDKYGSDILDFLMEFYVYAGPIVRLHWDAIVGGLRAFFAVLGLLIDLGKGWRDFTWELTQGWEDVKSAFKNGDDLIDGLVDGLKAGFSRLKSAVEELGRAIINAFKNFFGINSPSTLMIEQAGFIIDGIALGLAAFDKLVGAMQNIANFLIEQWHAQDIPGRLREAGTNAVSALDAGAKTAVNMLNPGAAVGNFVIDQFRDRNVPGMLASIADRVGPAIGGAIDAGKAIAGSASTALGEWVKSRLSGANLPSRFMSEGSAATDAMSAGISARRAQAEGAMRNVVNAVYTVLSTIHHSIGSALAPLGSTFAQSFSAGIPAVRGAMASIASAVSSAASSLPGLLVRAGSAMMGGLIGSISAGIGRVRSMLNGLTNMIPSWKGPLDRDRKLLTPAGEAIMQSLLDGLKVGAPYIKKYLSGFTDDISTTFSSVSPTFDPTLLATSGGHDPRSGTNINITNYYPQAEPNSTTVNRALQLAAAF